jgi:hypothetical protein
MSLTLAKRKVTCFEEIKSLLSEDIYIVKTKDGYDAVLKDRVVASCPTAKPLEIWAFRRGANKVITRAKKNWHYKEDDE